MVQTIPKLIPISTAGGRCPTKTGTRGIPAGHRVCRFPGKIDDPYLTNSVKPDPAKACV